MRIALGLCYNGQAYQGWQSQSSGQTVQDKLEAALAQFTGLKALTNSLTLHARPPGPPRVVTLCAGRTDAGVHALMQVVHFDTAAAREPQSWVRGVNALLPRDIAVQWAAVVPATFHCRASALSRRYAYVLLESPVRPSIEAGRVGWVYQPMNQAALQTAAAQLIGEHDFSSFRASSCQALSPVKTLQRIDVSRRGAYWHFEFEANAFLHHMIRNIMGCLIAVGTGRQTQTWLAQALAARRRDIAAPTFSPDGLYFLGPNYASQWGLPDSTPAYDWLP